MHLAGARLIPHPQAAIGPRPGPWGRAGRQAGGQRGSGTQLPTEAAAGLVCGVLRKGTPGRL